MWKDERVAPTRVCKALRIVLLGMLTIISGAVAVACTAQTSYLSPSPRADQDFYVYVESGNVWTTNSQGTTHTQLTFSGHDSVPQLSPDGRWVVYLTVSPGSLGSAPIPQDICVLQISTLERRCLTSQPVLRGRPVWNPSGDRLAFVEDGQLVVISLDGKERKVVTAGVGANGPAYAVPTWSPDGSLLVCAMLDEIGPALWSVGVDTGERTPLVRVASVPGAPPVFSPDGKLVAFPHPEDNHRIWTVPALGGDAIPLAGSPSDVYSFAWSPSGLHLAYARVDGTIWLADTGHATHAPSLPGDTRAPSLAAQRASPPEISWLPSDAGLVLTAQVAGGTALSMMSLPDRLVVPVTPGADTEEIRSPEQALGAAMVDIPVPYRWQGAPDSGACASANCGPTSVAMAIQWAHAGEWVDAADIRSYVSGTNCRWTNLNDLSGALNRWGVAHQWINGVDAVREAISQRGHPVIVPVIMGSIPPGTDYETPRASSPPSQHFQRYYAFASGHFLVAKGISSDGNWLLVQDPDVFTSGNYWYLDNTPKGNTRYYKMGDFAAALEANGNWGLEISQTWHAEYFADKSLTSSCYAGSEGGTYLFKRWDSEPPASGCPHDNYSARFTRRVVFAGGSYTFHLDHADGARLFVDGQKVIDAWTNGTSGQDFTMALTGAHEIKVEQYRSGTAAGLTLWWVGPGALPTAVPADPSQWRAEYYGNDALWGQPALVQNAGTGTIDSSWNNTGPGSSLPVDRWSARFTRNIAAACGRYRFTVHVDDGIRLWVGNQRVLDEWRPQVADFSPEIDLPGGSASIRVEYYENTEAAALKLSWSQISSCPAIPVADFDASPLAGPVPLTVAFRNLATGNYSACSWDYGDGGSGTMCDPSHLHTYDRPGTFTVTQTVSGPLGLDVRVRPGYVEAQPEPKRSYLPLLTRSQPAMLPAGIHGRVSYLGNPVSNLELELRLYTKGSWTTALTTTTRIDGIYNLTGAATLASGEQYYVRYRNEAGLNPANPNYLYRWYSHNITSYTSGSKRAGGDFDVANIPLLTPAARAQVSLPQTFSWSMRPVSSNEEYQFALNDPTPGARLIFSGNASLGHVSSTKLDALPSGTYTGIPYVWSIWACTPGCNPLDSYGLSFESRQITFSAGSQRSRLVSPLRSVDSERLADLAEEWKTRAMLAHR